MITETKNGPDIALLQDAAEFQTRHPDSLIIGSVARAAIMAEELSAVRASGVARDIDIVRMGDRTSELYTSDKREIDPLFENWIAADGMYLVFPHDPRLQVKIKHPEVFQPHEVSIGDYRLAVPHPDVLGKMSTMQFIQRPKDKKAATAYDKFLHGQQDHLPAELLEPFDTLRTALSQRYGYRGRGLLRNAYHRAVPEVTRKKLDLGERLHWLRHR
jgi:hypothetical protein